MSLLSCTSFDCSALQGQLCYLCACVTALVWRSACTEHATVPQVHVHTAFVYVCVFKYPSLWVHVCASPNTCPNSRSQLICVTCTQRCTTALIHSYAVVMGRCTVCTHINTQVQSVQSEPPSSLEESSTVTDLISSTPVPLWKAKCLIRTREMGRDKWQCGFGKMYSTELTLNCLCVCEWDCVSALWSVPGSFFRDMDAYSVY